VVNVLPVPDITLVSSDNASQNVDVGTAISAISYTASYSGTFTKTGDFPSGVTGSADGSSYTIYGTPTETGTFGYSLTASVNGCSSTPAAGTITVNVTTPPGAASTQTWVVGNQTWSAPLKVVSGCEVATNFGTYASHPAAYVRTSGVYSGSGYLYSSLCVVETASTLCPAPWRLPTKADFISLDESFGGNGANRTSVSEDYVTLNYITKWGAVLGGYAVMEIIDQVEQTAYYWSSTIEGTMHYYLATSLTYLTVSPQTKFDNNWQGYQVRCVK
jgi:uncharacterized protein (TIGR02145 family)